MKRYYSLLWDLVGLAAMLVLLYAMTFRTEWLRRPIDPSTGLRKPFTGVEQAVWVGVAVVGTGVGGYRRFVRTRRLFRERR